MAAEGPSRGGWFAVAVIVAIASVFVAYAVVTYLLDAEFSLARSLVTAVVVGAFAFLLLIRPRRKQTTFTVDAVETVGSDEGPVEETETETETEG